MFYGCKNNQTYLSHSHYISLLSIDAGQLEKLLEKNFYLNKAAKDAYRSYIHAYASHAHKDIFDVYKLDLIKVAKGFGFTDPPMVHIGNISCKYLSSIHLSIYSSINLSIYQSIKC